MGSVFGENCRDDKEEGDQDKIPCFKMDWRQTPAYRSQEFLWKGIKMGLRERVYEENKDKKYSSASGAI